MKILKNIITIITSASISLLSIAGNLDDAVRAHASGNYQLAIEKYKLAAAEGSATALGNLGRMYAIGEGVEKNTEQSTRYFRLAVEKGDTSSMYDMGVHHANEKNYIFSYHWFNLASIMISTLPRNKDNSSELQEAITAREKIKQNLTKTEIELAGRITKECLDKKLKNCK